MTTEASTLGEARRAFRANLDAGDMMAAMRSARTLLGESPHGGTASFIRRAVEKTSSSQLPLAPLRVALLASFSIEFLHDTLVAFGFVEGLRIDLYQAGFGQFRQDILNPASGLYAFAPDVVALALEGKDLVPDLYRHDAPDGDASLETAVAEAGQELAALAQAFRERSAATLLVHNFAPPTWRRLGILDGQLGPSQAEL